MVEEIMVRDLKVSDKVLVIDSRRWRADRIIGIGTICKVAEKFIVIEYIDTHKETVQKKFRKSGEEYGSKNDYGYTGTKIEPYSKNRELELRTQVLREDILARVSSKMDKIREAKRNGAYGMTLPQLKRLEVAVDAVFAVISGEGEMND